MFELLFERSADAIWLFDPQAGVFVDCNQAAVELLRAGTKEKLLQTRPEELSPLRQPDGTLSRDKAVEVAALSSRHGGYRFEWLGHRLDGTLIPLEVVTTPSHSTAEIFMSWSHATLPPEKGTKPRSSD